MKVRLQEIGALISVLAVPWCASLAQTGTARISGTVVDFSSGSTLSNVDILHLGVRRNVLSDSSGRYLIGDLPAGIARLLVRARGFPPIIVVLALARDESLLREISLDSTATAREQVQRLPAVATTARSATPPRYADFERRRLTGRGQYLVRENIVKGGFASLQDAMRGLRGVNLDCGGGLGCAIRMARSPMRCSPEYIVDERVDNIFGPSTAIGDIEAIEVYTGPSDVPGEFAGRTAGCGVVVIWTRSGPTPPKP